MRQILTFCTIAALLCALAAPAPAAEYRVGEGEEYAKLSDVAGKLRPGDTVTVTSDISDSPTIENSGRLGQPITIRGEISGGRRPRITNVPEETDILRITGSYVTVRGLALAPADPARARWGSGIWTTGTQIVVENCVFENCWEGFGCRNAEARVRLDRCEFVDCGAWFHGSAVKIYAAGAGGQAIVRNCAFRGGTGATHVHSYCKRLRVEGCWFDSPYYSSLKCADNWTQRTTEVSYPQHCDIVGNVFVQGDGPGPPWSILQLGGEGQTSPGMEGDLNVAHNLILVSRGGSEPGTALLVHGNVDRLRLYNNVILSTVAGGKFYERGTTWADAERTRRFAEMHGRRDPEILGSNNWIGESCIGVPDSLEGTVRGVNPGFVDLVGGDLRPAKGSPPANAGAARLPLGCVDSLLPALEPRRHIPADAELRERPAEEIPTIGPFAAAGRAPVEGDASEILLSMPAPERRFPWPLDWERALQAARRLAAAGEGPKALEAARAALILAPTEEELRPDIIEALSGVVEMAEGSGERAEAFARFALLGPAGADGEEGTADDLEEALSGVGTGFLWASDEEIEAVDRRCDDAAAIVKEAGHYAESGVLWYASEKALARANAGRFEAAAAMLGELLIEASRLPSGTGPDSLEHRLNREVQERAEAGLSAVYRAGSGTFAGADEFVTTCRDYMTYGPAGPDAEYGTDDDLTPPL